MGRASVRAQLASYFSPANVGSSLATTYPSRPKEVPGQAFNLSQNGGSGGVLIIYLPNDDEKRLTLGPPTAAQKFNVHDVAMEVRFQSVKPDAIAAQADHDALIDAIMTQFRKDRTLGSTNGVPIWQAGEGSEGIKLTLSEPKLSKQSFVLNGVIRFQAYEVVTG